MLQIISKITSIKSFIIPLWNNSLIKNYQKTIMITCVALNFSTTVTVVEQFPDIVIWALAKPKMAATRMRANILKKYFTKLHNWLLFHSMLSTKLVTKGSKWSLYGVKHSHRLISNDDDLSLWSNYIKNPKHFSVLSWTA